MYPEDSGYKIIWKAMQTEVMHGLLTFGAPLHLSMAESRLAPLHKDPRMLRTERSEGATWDLKEPKNGGSRRLRSP